MKTVRIAPATPTVTVAPAVQVPTVTLTPELQAAVDLLTAAGVRVHVPKAKVLFTLNAEQETAKALLVAAGVRVSIPKVKSIPTGRKATPAAIAGQKEGFRLRKIAGNPKQAVMESVYGVGSKASLGGWADRAAAGVPAAEFQACLAAGCTAFQWKARKEAAAAKA